MHHCLKRTSLNTSLKRSISEIRRKVTVQEPLPKLLEGCFERPTPILFLPWECRGAQHWAKHMQYFSERGVLTASFDFKEDGLDAMEEQVVGVIKALNSIPPVIIGRSIGSFVAQRFLRSHAASGMVLIDPFPPNPTEMAMYLAAEALDCELDQVEGILTSTAEHSEKLLRNFFIEGIWQDSEDEGNDFFRFPIKTFTEMISASSKVHVEPESTNMLVASTNMTELAPPEIAIETSNYHKALVTWVVGDDSLISTMYKWYDDRF